MNRFIMTESSINFYKIYLVFILVFCSCNNSAQTDSVNDTVTKTKDTIASIDSSIVEHDSLKIADVESNVEIEKSIHIIVALCDNKYQGIVPVPKTLGNGQETKSNLYWGALYGVKTHFKKSKEWKLLKSYKVNDKILERIVFKHIKYDYYLVADAYNGKNIKEATDVFLKNLSGMMKNTIEIEGEIIGLGSNASLVSYIGHDGLMDFSLPNTYISKDNIKRDAIILACYSKHFFKPYLSKMNVNPLVWTSGLMAPEAYIIHDALSGYVQNETNEQIRERAARAYSEYQKCSLKAANRLLISGF